MLHLGAGNALSRVIDAPSGGLVMLHLGAGNAPSRGW